VCCDNDCASDETLTGQTSMCAVLMVLAGMLKHGKRDDLIEFGKLTTSFVFVIINVCELFTMRENKVLHESLGSTG